LAGLKTSDGFLSGATGLEVLAGGLEIDPGLAHQSGQIDPGLQCVEIVAREVIHETSIRNLQTFIRFVFEK
jgi:hypothetical protein